MKAAQIDRFGGPEVFSIVDVPPPSPGEGEVLIKVAVAGVNAAELNLRRNTFFVTPELPTILGSEIVGVVEKLGVSVQTLKIGDRVAAPLFAYGVRSGGYAEFAVAKAEYVVPIPDGVNFDDAAAALLQGLTGYFLTKAYSPEDKTVLITAAAGGVGGWLIQFARLGGARVIIGAAGGAAKIEAIRQMGIDGAVDYTNSAWPAAVLAATNEVKPDIVYDSAGGDIFNDALALLADHGTMVFYGSNNLKADSISTAQLRAMTIRNLKLGSFGIGGHLTPDRLRAGLNDIFSLLSRGAVRPRIAARYSLEQVSEAHRSLESRRTLGKVLLIISP